MHEQKLSFHVQWEQHGFTYNNALSQLYHQKCFTDVILICQENFFHAHKFVLAAASEYFFNIFQNMTTVNPHIVLNEIHVKDLHSLLEFMYLGETLIEQDNIVSVVKAAELFKIKGLSSDHGSPSTSGIPKTKIANTSCVPANKASTERSPSLGVSKNISTKRKKRQLKQKTDPKIYQEARVIIEKLPIGELSCASYDSSGMNSISFADEESVLVNDFEGFDDMENREQHIVNCHNSQSPIFNNALDDRTTDEMKTDDGKELKQKINATKELYDRSMSPGNITDCFMETNHLLTSGDDTNLINEDGANFLKKPESISLMSSEECRIDHPSSTSIDDEVVKLEEDVDLTQSFKLSAIGRKDCQRTSGCI